MTNLRVMSNTECVLEVRYHLNSLLILFFLSFLQVLHAPVPFLLFTVEKQAEAIGTQFLFKRQSEAARNLISETLTLIKQGRAVLWLGASGTAKSSSMNEVVVSVLRELGTPDGPDVLLVRADIVLFVFSIKDSILVCETRTFQHSELGYFKAKGKVVLVYELLEGQQLLRFFFPFLFRRKQSQHSKGHRLRSCHLLMQGRRRPKGSDQAWRLLAAC